MTTIRSSASEGERSLFQPRAVLAGVQPPRAGGSVQPGASAARAAALPVDLGLQPRRILHGPRRRAEGPAAAGRRAPFRRRPDPGASSSPRSSPRPTRWSTSQQRRLARLAPRSSPRRASQVLGSRTIDEARRPRIAAGSKTHFREQIFPILTPQALDPAHPFPFMPNKGLAVIFDLVRAVGRRADPRTGDAARDDAALRAPAGRAGALCRGRDRWCKRFVVDHLPGLSR